MTTIRQIRRGRWISIACLAVLAFGFGLSTSSFFAQTKPSTIQSRVNQHRQLVGDMFASGARGTEELKAVGLELESELLKSHHWAIAEFHKKPLDLQRTEANVDEVNNFIQQEAGRFRTYLEQARKRSQDPEQMKRQHELVFSYLGDALATLETQNQSTKRMLRSK